MRKSERKFQKKGFTLIEILIVIGIISILAAIVIIAINPARQFAQSRNAQRWSNVNTILNAVHQYGVDNAGILPATIAGPAAEVCSSSVATTSCGALINLTDVLIGTSEIYVVGIPNDPLCPDSCATDGAGYTIATSSNGRVTVAAPNAELGVTISVTR